MGFYFKDEKSGLTARVVQIDRVDDEEGTYVEVHIFDRADKKVGEAFRTIHPAFNGEPTYVYHDSFVLDGPMQGQGFAARWGASVEQSYREQGIKQIRLHANIDVGGYAWARAGYNFAKRDADSGISSRENVGRNALKLAKRYDASVQKQVQAVVGNPRSTPADFAMIGHTPGARTWPGKEIMLDDGSHWSGVKKL